VLAPWGKVLTPQPLLTLPQSELFDFHKEIESGYLVFWISNRLPSKGIILIMWRSKLLTTQMRELNIKGI
jgi:hypothetical protein